MFESRWLRLPVLLVTPAVAVAAFGLAGCGSSPSQASGASSATSASTAKPAGTGAQTVSFTAAKLRGALLTKVNGVAAAVPAAEGTYSTLPGTKREKQSGVAVNPKVCATNTMTGLPAGDLQSAPAASVAFKVGGNGVSEVLLSPSDVAAANVLGQGVPAECTHYTATISGKTYDYTVKDSSLSGIGKQARLISVQAAGYPADNVWAVLYRGTGFVGAVTVVGPNSSEAAAKELGTQAYGYAAKSLA